MAGGSRKILILIFMFASCVSVIIGSLSGIFIYDSGGTPTTTDESGNSVTKLDVDVSVSGTILPNGIKCWYTGKSLDENGLKWNDASGNGNDIKGDNLKGLLKMALDPVSGKYVYGTVEDGIIIPFDFTGSNWTLFTVARYNDKKKSRIFDGTGVNWLGGWHGGRTGLAYYGKGWATPQVNVHGSGRTWIQTTAYRTQFFSNGDKRTPDATFATGEAPGKIAINMGKHQARESSDWAVHEIIVYGRALSQKDRVKVEKYLLDTYISPEIQSGIDYVKGFSNHPQSRLINRNEIGGTLEKCRLYAVKMGYKMWGHRTEKNADDLKNVCFFYANTDCASYEGDTTDEKHIVGCAEKGVKVKDGCKTQDEIDNNTTTCESESQSPAISSYVGYPSCDLDATKKEMEARLNQGFQLNQAGGESCKNNNCPEDCWEKSLS